MSAKRRLLTSFFSRSYVSPFSGLKIQNSSVTSQSTLHERNNDFTVPLVKDRWNRFFNSFKRLTTTTVMEEFCLADGPRHTLRTPPHPPPGPGARLYWRSSGKRSSWWDMDSAGSSLDWSQRVSESIGSPGSQHVSSKANYDKIPYIPILIFCLWYVVSLGSLWWKDGTSPFAYTRLRSNDLFIPE